MTFPNDQTGALILESAKALIGLNRQRKQMEFQQKQFAQQVEMQQRNMDLREKNAQIQAEYAENQRLKLAAGEEQRAATLEKTRAEIGLIRAKEAGEKRGDTAGPKGTFPQLLNVHKRVVETKSNEAFSRAADRLGFAMNAGDTLASIRAERSSLIKGQSMAHLAMRLAESDEARAAAGAPLQRLQAIDQLLSDPSLNSDLARLREMSPTDEDVQAEYRKGLRVISGFTGSEEELDALSRELQAQAGAEESAEVGLFPGMPSTVFSSVALDAFHGRIDGLKGLILHHKLLSADDSTHNRQVFKRLAVQLQGEGFSEPQVIRILRELKKGL